MKRPPEFDGYVEADITYAVAPGSDAFFPVKVVALSKHFLEVVALDVGLLSEAAPEFSAEPANRRFYRPTLPPSSRFGGYDERLVNSERASGAELRLLPTHYGTITGGLIRDKHLEDPERWPLPTGVLFDRWFKPADREPTTG